MNLHAIALAPKYRHILDHYQPYLISYPSNWPALDLSPFGVSIREPQRFTATRLSSRDVIDGLHHLDAATFGDQNMRMPRWVLFDCGEFPGIVFGFGCRANQLPPYVRSLYQVDTRDDAFVPLSMWVAIRCAEEGAWFGHNLSSANVILQGTDRLPGLATLTKILGVKVTQARRQYGATQWCSKSLGLHLRLGRMQLLSAYTPAHTHPNTLSYRIDVRDEHLLRSLKPDWQPQHETAAHTLMANDDHAIRQLHDRIEQGEHWRLFRSEKAQGVNRLHLEAFFPPHS